VTRLTGRRKYDGQVFYIRVGASRCLTPDSQREFHDAARATALGRR